MLITITVDHEVLDRLFETARSAIEANRALSFQLTMASTALPAKHDLWFLLLDDLDVSEDQWYPITQFELNPTIARLRDATDVRPRKPDESSRDRARFNVQLDEVRAGMYSDRLRFSSASMSGRITYPVELRESVTTVEIEEYERDWHTREYPEEAFPGTFYFYPESGQLDLTLRFTRRDFEVLIPVILGSRKVELSVSLTATKAEIAAAKEVLHGEIASYGVTFNAAKGQ
jgi:hypothetical protein